MTFEEVVRVRRSYRKYEDRPIEPEKWEALRATAVRACEAFSLASVRFVFVREPAARRKFIRASFSGLMGKVNPWLLVTKAPGFIALAGAVGKGGDAELYLAEAALAMEAVLLAAAELGLATCWIGGFGERKLASLLGLPEGVRLLAISPVGYPPGSTDFRFDWDTLVRQAVSKNRKPLAEIVRMADAGGAR